MPAKAAEALAVIAKYASQGDAEREKVLAGLGKMTWRLSDRDPAETWTPQAAARDRKFGEARFIGEGQK